MAALCLYLACGAAAGLFSGLLGLGGGLIVVPLLIAVFNAGGIAPELGLRMAVATSLSSILFTSLSSTLAHARRGCVVWPFARKIVCGLVLGTACGSILASRFSSVGLQLFFACFVCLVGTQMLVDFYPRPKGLPGALAINVTGLAIGGVSSLVGLGGGSLSVPYLRWCGFDMRRAIGTSAALAWPIAITGTLGYVLTGWNAPDLPAYSLGYVNVSAVLGIACSSVLAAPLGVRLAHALPAWTLRKIFAVFLYIIAFRMFWGVI